MGTRRLKRKAPADSPESGDIRSAAGPRLLWNGVPLDEEELELIRILLKRVLHERRGRRPPPG